MTLKLTGTLNDGRLAQGNVNVQVAFLRGARVTRAVENLSEFQVFCQTESYWDLAAFWLQPSRRIEKAFFRVPLPVHEREFIKAAGSLSVPLTGLNIKQYLTYLLVEHSYAINLYSCREFCGFFKRKLDDETSIRYRDIVTLIKERNSGVNHDDLFLSPHLVFNPHHWLLVAWDFLARIVSLYHIAMVPVRICFQSEAYTMTSPLLLLTDLPADLILFLHLLISLNIGYKNSKSQWVTKRYRIAKNIDGLAVIATIPIDWLVYLSGLDSQSAVWCRVTKMLLYWSKIKPGPLLYSARGGELRDLIIQFLLIMHICSCLYYYIGRKVPELKLGSMYQISWLQADSSLGIDTYSREGYHPAMAKDATHLEHYILCLYWVISTVTCQGVVGDVVPSNYVEVAYSIVLLLFNLTIYRWIQGEIANWVMSTDEKVIQAREEQDRILKFISVKSFSPDLRERIQSHFLAVQGNDSGEQEELLRSLSHGLRVELARLIWRDFLAKVSLFRGCTGQFLDAMCVLLQETNYGPEEIIGNSGEVSERLVILVYGALEAYTNDSEKIKKMSRKGTAVGPLSFFFGVKQFMSTRAARSGAVCISISREGMQEVLQIYPKVMPSLSFRAGRWFRDVCVMRDPRWLCQ